MLFEKYADDYARYRPGYPEDLLTLLIKNFNLDNNSLVLDLACGTGNLGRQIQKLTDVLVFGLDSSLILLKHCSGLSISSGKAEMMPYRSGSFDAVFTGQAFHWFDFEKALDEIFRIVKPGGGLAIVWYRRKRPLDNHRLKLDELVKKINPDYEPGFMNYDWNQIILDHGGFRDLESCSINHVLKYSIPDYLKLQRSKSYVGDAMTAESMEMFFNEAEDILNDYYPDGEILEKMTYQYVSAVKS